jgi:SAM-dependent methyltransferase
MPLKCPFCESPLLNNNKEYKCDNDHQIVSENGVLILQEPSFTEWYTPWEIKFRAYREKEKLKIKDPSTYNQLPFVPNKLGMGFWKAKTRDLQIIRNMLDGSESLKILEIGAWNCWLTNHLNKMGHGVTAVDYFLDPFDGLGAKQHYSRNNWLAIQMNLERLDLIDDKFDLIIINRMIAYFENPIETLKKLITEKLNKNGKIIVTGTITTKNKKHSNKKFYREMKEFEKKEGFSLRIKPFFGAFTSVELEKCKELGFKLHPYKEEWIEKFKKLVKPKISGQMYLVFEN